MSSFMLLLLPPPFFPASAKMGFHQHQWTFQGQVGLGGPCLSPLWPDINHKPTFTCTYSI